MFDVAAVRAALEPRLKSLELELHQVERLQRKFAMIHSTLAQQQSHGGAKAEADTPKMGGGGQQGLGRGSEENPLNLSRSSMPGGAGNVKVRAVQWDARCCWAGWLAGWLQHRWCC